MMGLSPGDDPTECGGGKRSGPSPGYPRRDSARAAAAPMAPRPATMTSNSAAIVGLVRRTAFEDLVHHRLLVRPLLLLGLVRTPREVPGVQVHQRVDDDGRP